MSLASVDEMERAIGERSPGQIEDMYDRLDRNFESARNEHISSDVAAGQRQDAIFRTLGDESNGRQRKIKEGP